MEADNQLSFEEDIQQAEELKQILRTAANEDPLKVYPHGDSLPNMLPRLPRWPSGLGFGFDTPYGGFQAVTVLGGDAGVGKSTLSMACALENARDGACVVYFDAENAAGEQRVRAVMWHGGESHFTAAQQHLAMNFTWSQIDNRHSWATMLVFASQRIRHVHKRVLIVLDSMQTIADEIDTSGNMLAVTAAIYSAMNRIVRESEGRISFLVLSELNKESGLKGGVAKYRGTMIMRITRDDLPGGEPDYRIDLLKNRTGRTPGDLGLYRLEWWRCRFEKVQVS